MSSYEEKLELREQGLSYTQIAEKLGVSPQAVRQALAKHNPKYFQFVTEKGCIYKGLREWMNENKVSRAELIRRMGYEPLSETHTRFGNYLSGRSDFRKTNIDGILKVTGMTYEQAFGDPDAVDVAPIVRCKDCKYCDVGENDAESWIFCKIHIIETYPNDFCSYAERKEQ